MKVALVTGASKGLGRSIAVTLARDGWAVAVNYAHDDAGAATTLAAIAALGGRAIGARFDVTDADQVETGLAAIASGLGPVDLIVNNATGPQGAVPLAEQHWGLYQHHLDFFVKAPFLLLKAALADWRQRKSGRIINIGSEVTHVGNARDAHYVAAKSAMIGLTRSWASELGAENITVNLVSPGWIPVERHEGTDPGEYVRHLERVPLGRMGKPEDIANMVAFIASPAADFITGQDIAVNGGRTFS